MRVALQPASLSSPVVRRHYEDTVDTPVELSRHRHTLGADYEPLARAHPEGRAALWGVVPGKSGVNIGKYNKLEVGDYVFFYGQKRLYLGGYVTHTFHNRELASRLWTLDPRGQAWEYMYSLGSPRGFSVPIEEVRECLGTSPNFFVQNLYVAEGVKARRLAELCNLGGPQRGRVRRRLGAGPGERPVEDPGPGPTDRPSEGTYRAEQSELRSRLLASGEVVCALCGRDVPEDLLVAAHIKKRSRCTEEERRDLDNVAMLACEFGCDRLFENGYVAVAPDGELLMSPEVTNDPHVEDYADRHLKGRQVWWHTADRAHYFAWHRTRTFMAPPAPLD